MFQLKTLSQMTAVQRTARQRVSLCSPTIPVCRRWRPCFRVKRPQAEDVRPPPQMSSFSANAASIRRSMCSRQPNARVSDHCLFSLPRRVANRSIMCPNRWAVDSHQLCLLISSIASTVRYESEHGTFRQQRHMVLRMLRRVSPYRQVLRTPFSIPSVPLPWIRPCRPHAAQFTRSSPPATSSFALAQAQLYSYTNRNASQSSPCRDISGRPTSHAPLSLHLSPVPKLMKATPTVRLHTTLHSPMSPALAFQTWATLPLRKPPGTDPQTPTIS